jgi:hypothetical protein
MSAYGVVRRSATTGRALKTGGALSLWMKNCYPRYPVSLPNLPNFPHQVHMTEEFHVEPGRLLSVIELINVIEQELRAWVCIHFLGYTETSTVSPRMAQKA